MPGKGDATKAAEMPAAAVAFQSVSLDKTQAEAEPTRVPRQMDVKIFMLLESSCCRIVLFSSSCRFL